MLCDISSSPAWLAHLTQRFAEATDLGLLDPKAVPSWQTAKVFVPTHLDCTSLSEIEPQRSLRSLGLDSVVEGAGWVLREDLFAEAGRWLCTAYAAGSEVWLVCEAGYSNAGDKVLQQRPHVMQAGRPLLRIEVGSANIDEVATVLRWGRSSRSLGAVMSGDGACLAFRPAMRGLFICDAFDGDSLIVASLDG